MKLARSRPVLLGRDHVPVLILTDGACEGIPREAGGQGLQVSFGGVIYDPTSGTVECFGTEAPDEIVELWSEGGAKTQVIGQAEIAPAITARLLWGQLLIGRRVLHFIDNDAAREGLIKGTSGSPGSAALLGVFWDLETVWEAYTWFERVPSPSNVADGPSRLDFETAIKVLKAKRRSPPSLPAHLLRESQKRASGVQG